MNLVPRAHTPVPLSGLLAAIEAAHEGLRGFGLTPDAYRLAQAHLEFEHGTAGGELRGVFGFNFGNHDATSADIANGAPVFATVPEHEGSVASTLTQVHHRRAYDDLDDGLRGYWQALLEGFPTAYDAMGTGEPAALAHALRWGEPGRPYYTADESTYAAGLAARLRDVPAWDAAATLETGAPAGGGLF